jgi:hypothetical protein
MFSACKGAFMKKIIAAFLVGIFSFSLFACVTRDTNKIDRAKDSNNRAQREMDRAFK